MVNKKSITGPAVTSGSTSSVTVAGGSSTPSSSTAGSGSAPASAPAPIPGAGTKAKRGLRTEVTTVFNGIGSQLPDDSNLVVSGTPVSKQSLLTAFAAVLALFADVDTAVQAAKNQRLALTAATPAARQLLANVKAAVVALFGKGNPALAAFGFSGTQPRQLTTEQKFVRDVKAKATRLQRGTLGPRKKQSVKFQGQVQVQANVAGTQTSGGNAPATSGNAGAASNTPAAGASPSGSGNTGSSAS